MKRTSKAGNSLPTTVSDTQLAKDSAPEQIKAYFSKILELTKTGMEFPINLDDVWPLVYKRRDYALKELRISFIEGEDYNLRQKAKVVISNNLINGIKIDAELSVSCMEYFIAKKVRPVFEVYRKVFHRAVGQQKAIGSEATYNDGQVHRVILGNTTINACSVDGIKYWHLKQLGKYFGVDIDMSSFMKRSVGIENAKKILIGKQGQWFVNSQGVMNAVHNLRADVNSEQYRNIEIDLFGISKGSEKEHTYRFTDKQMLSLFHEASKIDRVRLQKTIMDMLREGRVK